MNREPNEQTMSPVGNSALLLGGKEGGSTSAMGCSSTYMINFLLELLDWKFCVCYVLWMVWCILFSVHGCRFALLRFIDVLELDCIMQIKDLWCNILMFNKYILLIV